jgi:hypothetical protein
VGSFVLIRDSCLDAAPSISPVMGVTQSDQYASNVALDKVNTPNHYSLVHPFI